MGKGCQITKKGHEKGAEHNRGGIKEEGKRMVKPTSGKKNRCSDEDGEKGASELREKSNGRGGLAASNSHKMDTRGSNGKGQREIRRVPCEGIKVAS